MIRNDRGIVSVPSAAARRRVKGKTVEPCPNARTNDRSRDDGNHDNEKDRVAS